MANLTAGQLPRRGVTQHALSQARLATVGGVARASVGNLEHGGLARADTLNRLAKALGVTLDGLQPQPEV